MPSPMLATRHALVYRVTILSYHEIYNAANLLRASSSPAPRPMALAIAPLVAAIVMELYPREHP
jgi:hypothetical protein